MTKSRENLALGKAVGVIIGALRRQPQVTSVILIGIGHDAAVINVMTKHKGRSRHGRVRLGEHVLSFNVTIPKETANIILSDKATKALNERIAKRKAS